MPPGIPIRTRVYKFQYKRTRCFCCHSDTIDHSDNYSFCLCAKCFKLAFPDNEDDYHPSIQFIAYCDSEYQFGIYHYNGPQTN